MDEAKWKGCAVMPWQQGWSCARAGIIDATYLGDLVLPGCRYGDLFAYLFRRFGTPDPRMFDWSKQLCGYHLTTPDPEVGFWLSCSPCPGLTAQPGYLLSPARTVLILEQDRLASRDWPPSDPAKGIFCSPLAPEGTITRRTVDAIATGMRDLLRPVYVRDMPINALGYLTNKQVGALGLEPAAHAWND